MGEDRKGNFIHVYNPLALQPDLETECWSGSDSSAISPCSSRDLANESICEALPGRDSGDLDLRAGSEESQESVNLSLPIAAFSAFGPQAIVAVVQRWYRQFGFCCSAQEYGTVPAVQLHNIREQLTVQDDLEIDINDDAIAKKQDLEDTQILSLAERETIVPCNDAAACEVREGESSPSPRAQVDTIVSIADPPPNVDPAGNVDNVVIPQNVLVEVDSLVGKVGDFLDLRHQFKDTFAKICQREEESYLSIKSNAAHPSSVNKYARNADSLASISPMSARCNMFLEQCLTSAHLDLSSLRQDADDTISIGCTSLQKLDGVFQQILQHSSGWPLAVVGIENNLQPVLPSASQSSAYTKYPSLILLLQDSDKEDPNTYRVELHHLALLTLQYENRALYSPFAAVASSRHASFLDRLFTATPPDLRDVICAVLTESNASAIRALRVLLALLQREPDSGALGEFVLECLVRNMDNDQSQEATALAQVHNSYAAMLHKKAQRQVDLCTLDEAERLYKQALDEIHPTYSEHSSLLCDFARLLEQRGNFGDAEELLWRALRLQNPTHTAAHQLARILMQRDAFSECSTLCVEWDLSMEDIACELRKRGKLRSGLKRGCRCAKSSG